jgi:hypothetical protein
MRTIQYINRTEKNDLKIRHIQQTSNIQQHTEQQYPNTQNTQNTQNRQFINSWLQLSTTGQPRLAKHGEEQLVQIG